MDRDELKILRRSQLFADFREPTLLALLSKMNAVEVSRGTSLFFKGDDAKAAYLILEGKVDIFSLSPAGQIIVLNTLRDGDFFGELSLLDKQPRTAGAEAVTKCKIAVIEREDFLSIANDFDSTEWLSIIRYITGLVRKATDVVEATNFLSAEIRVIKKLLELSTRATMRSEEAAINITQQDLASGLGLARESTNRILSDLQKRGLIQKKYRSIVLKEPVLLKNLIGD